MSFGLRQPNQRRHRSSLSHTPSVFTHSALESSLRPPVASSSPRPHFPLAPFPKIQYPCVIRRTQIYLSDRSKLILYFYTDVLQSTRDGESWSSKDAHCFPRPLRKETKSMKPKEIEQWQKAREKGMVRFIF